ncbi:M23 family metallopeptidase [Agromyces atrinae]|uniref:M23 family metallopeptidase n=1 Tax=Agromyces atrinae TaxID=592376 RepID=UPI001F5A83E1|nr:M23 family metallopeptidase [Agromyces atrinae]MCI2957316.1 M23 family metallopeptidase [Agromyces atrinae]
MTRRQLRERERQATPSQPLTRAELRAAERAAAAASTATDAGESAVPREQSSEAEVPAVTMGTAVVPVIIEAASDQPLRRRSRRSAETSDAAEPGHLDVPLSSLPAEHVDADEFDAVLTAPSEHHRDIAAASEPVDSLPVLGLPEARTRVTDSVPPAARAAAAAAAPRKSFTRSVAGRALSGVAMTFVALMAVATTVPAGSLVSPSEVLASATVQSTAAAKVAEGTQSIQVAADSAPIPVERDGYAAASVAEYAAESGIRLEATFTNNPNGTIQWPFPVGVHIGDRFGYRNCAGCSSDHGGQDFNPGLGAPIQSIADGVVSIAEDGEGSLGVYMAIDHVIDGQTVTSVYAHMEHGSMRFAVGDVVSVGDVIGTTGSTGMSTGPHLHFEIRLGGVNGTKVDPLEWLYANTN